MSGKFGSCIRMSKNKRHRCKFLENAEITNLSWRGLVETGLLHSDGRNCLQVRIRMPSNNEECPWTGSEWSARFPLAPCPGRFHHSAPGLPVQRLQAVPMRLGFRCQSGGSHPGSLAPANSTAEKGCKSYEIHTSTEIRWGIQRFALQLTQTWSIETPTVLCVCWLPELHIVASKRSRHKSTKYHKMLLQIVFKNQLFCRLTEWQRNELCLHCVHQWNDILVLLKKILEHWVVQCSGKFATLTARVDKSGSLESWCKIRQEWKRSRLMRHYETAILSFLLTEGSRMKQLIKDTWSHLLTWLSVACCRIWLIQIFQKLKEDRLIWCKFRMGNHGKKAHTTPLKTNN